MVRTLSESRAAFGSRFPVTLSRAFHRYPAFQGAVDVSRSRYVLHDTADPDVFIAEVDTVFVATEVSLVQIFRVREGQIVMLRDYFAA